VTKFWQELLKWENKNRRCTMFLQELFFPEVRPVMLLLVFFLVLQNRTIGFEIKSL
jgi:hypothetical protein